MLATPNELFYFRVKQEGVRAIVEWQTIHEHNDEVFMIQHSTDGVQFETIYEQAGSNSRNETNEYSYLDILSPGQNYYRLLQEDIDGDQIFSEIILIENLDKGEAGIMVYPNPTIDIIKVAGVHDSCQVSLIDSYGKVITQSNYQAGAVIEMYHLPAGHYIIIVEQGVNRYTKRIQKL